MVDSYRIQFHEFFTKRKTPADLKLTASGHSAMNSGHMWVRTSRRYSVSASAGVIFMKCSGSGKIHGCGTSMSSAAVPAEDRKGMASSEAGYELKRGISVRWDMV